MDGFVQAQAEECGLATAHRVMGYHTADNVPTYDALARDFAVCHRWFCFASGPTFPNRFYELTGRPNIDRWGAWRVRQTRSPLHPCADGYHLRTVEQSAGVSWTEFEHSTSFLRFFDRHTFDSENVVSYDDPKKGFLARAIGKSAFGVLRRAALRGLSTRKLLRRTAVGSSATASRSSRKLVETLVASPKWEKTLLIIAYDEHGGFYDHVAPVPPVKVSPEMLPTTGVRVPCFVISPWVKGGSVFGSDALHFDHTSIFKTIARRFMSKDPPYMGARYAAAHDLSEILNDQMRPEQFRPFIPYTLVCVASRMNLDVQGASTRIGTPLWQYTPNGTDAQSFRFEDAGDGFVCIRTLAGLYVTTDAHPGHPGRPPGQRRAIKQDVEYRAGLVGFAQIRIFSAGGSLLSAISVADPTNFTISSAGDPRKGTAAPQRRQCGFRYRRRARRPGPAFADCHSGVSVGRDVAASAHYRHRAPITGTASRCLPAVHVGSGGRKPAPATPSGGHRASPCAGTRETAGASSGSTHGTSTSPRGPIWAEGSAGRSGRKSVTSRAPVTVTPAATTQPPARLCKNALLALLASALPA